MKSEMTQSHKIFAHDITLQTKKKKIVSLFYYIKNIIGVEELNSFE